MKSLFASGGKKSVKKRVKHAFKERSLYPVLTAQNLFKATQRKRLLQQIEKLVRAPEKHYRLLYLRLINSFVEFVQVFPVHNEARVGSLLDEGLHRAYYAMEAMIVADKDRSSTVSILISGELIDCSAAYSVVVLPLPVGPATNVIP